MAVVMILIAICNFLLGFFVYRSNRRSRLNCWYGFFGFITGFWVLSNFIIGFFPELFLLKIVYMIGALVPASAIMWILELCNEKTKKFNLFLLWLSAFLFSITPFFGDLFLTNIKKIYVGGFEGQYGPLFPFYATYLSGMFFLILYKLIKQYLKTEGITKTQIKFVLIGAMLWIFVAAFTSLIIPLFVGSFGYTSLDSPASLIFLIFTAYAITKHHFFNVKVIATELLTIILWLSLIVKISFSETYQDFIINSVLLLSVIVIGILLVRSVMKEVRQREKLEELTKEVEKAYEVEKKAHEGLRKLDEAKNQFLMATQHHLRTPLTAMRGYLDLISGGTYGRVPIKIKETLFKFQISTMRLIRIVNELLDISQFQLGKEVVLLQPDVDLLPMFKEVDEELRYEAEAKGIYLKVESLKQVLPKIKADPEKLKVALFNIVDNAIKYTHKGGVTVECKTTDDKLQIIVRDTGIGMSKEDLEGLFEKFFERGKEAQKVFALGRGIGVFLSSQIVKAHKGRIWAESEGKDKGSAFYIELPCSRA